jgi:hypothetical protein
MGAIVFFLGGRAVLVSIRWKPVHDTYWELWLFLLLLSLTGSLLYSKSLPIPFGI